MADYTEGLPFAGKPSGLDCVVPRQTSQAKDSRFAFTGLVHGYVTVLNGDGRKDTSPSAPRIKSGAEEERQRDQVG